MNSNISARYIYIYIYIYIERLLLSSLLIFSAYWTVFCLYIGPCRQSVQILVACCVAAGCYRKDILQVYRGKKYFSFFSWTSLYLLYASLFALISSISLIQYIYPIIYPSLPNKFQNAVGWDISLCESVLPWCFAALTFPFLHFCFYFVGKITYPWIRAFFRTWTSGEWKFFSIYSMFMGMILIGISSQTYVWTCPGWKLDWIESSSFSKSEEVCLYERVGVIFGTDTFIFTSRNQTVLWHSPVLHPLFIGVDSFFRHIDYTVAFLLHVFSGGYCTWFYALWTSYAIKQILQWGIICILLKKMTEPILGSILSYTTIFLLAASFTGTIMIVIPERLTLSTLTLVGFLYFYINVVLHPYFPIHRQGYQKWMEPILAIAATGTTILSGIVVLGAIVVRPYWKWRDSGRIKFLWIWAGTMVLILVGFCFSAPLTEYIRTFSSSENFSSNNQQFFHFAESCLFCPDYQMGVEPEFFLRIFENLGICYKNRYYVKETPITDVPVGYLWTGGVILALCCVGFATYWRNRFVLVAFLWLLLGYGVMGICGWGAAGNEMSLYAPYYSWAVVPLAVCGLQRCLGNKYHQTTLLVLVCAGVALVMNLHTIYTVTQVFREICPWP